MRLYSKGLRLAWWNKGIDDLLSLIVICPIVLPISIAISIFQTVQFTYLYLKGRDTHSYYWEMIDNSGLYKCHLHDKVFRDNCPGIINTAAEYIKLYEEVLDAQKPK